MFCDCDIGTRGFGDCCQKLFSFSICRYSAVNRLFRSAVQLLKQKFFYDVE